MICFTRDELRAYLVQELADETQARVEQHLSSCVTCCQTLDVLASDDLVRDYFEASLRDVGNGDETVETTSLSKTVEIEEVRDWQPFTADASQLPLQFGKFSLKEVLGSGGFGVVYRADDVDLGREVAVKIPHLGGLSPEVRQRFLQEGTAAARLHHPHIVQVHQSGIHRGVCFLVSEYCPGRTLRWRLEETGSVRPVQEAVRIVLRLTEAVAHAHQHGVIHRDIKPANVILDDQSAASGLPYCPKLTDFGTAKFVEADQSLTASGTLIGTAPYMAPEQVSGGPEVGPACDVYSLGVLLYELISGQLPIQGCGSADTIRKVVDSDAVPLYRAAAGIPRDLSAICGRCLEKKPLRRYQSAEELASDLRRFLAGEPTIARPLGPGSRLLRWGRRHPLPLTIMGTITLMLMLIVGGLIWHTVVQRQFTEQLTLASRQAFEQRDRAEASEARVRQLLYASDLRLAEKAWREGDFRTAHDLLRRYVPSQDHVDMRGIEWFFLDHALHARVETIAEVGSALYFVRLAPDSNSFVTAGGDGVIRRYAVETGELLQSIDSGQVEVNSVAFSPDGAKLVSAGDDGSICLWSTRSGKRMRRIEAHNGMAFGVEFVSQGQQLVSCGTDAKVHLWDAATGKRLATHEDHKARVEAITVSPDGRWLASVGKDRTLVVRDLRNKQVHLRWDEAEGTLSAVAFSPESTRVAVVQSGGEKKWLRVFDVVSKSLILARQHPDAIRSVAFSPTGEHLLTADTVGVARVWKLKNERDVPQLAIESVATKQVQEDRLYFAAFGRRGDSLLAVGKTGRVVRWNWRRADVVVWEDRNILDLHDVAFASNNLEALLAYNGGVVSVDSRGVEDVWFNIRSGQRFVNKVAVSPRGEWIIVAKSTSHGAASHGRLRPATVERYVKSRSPQLLLKTKANYRINDLCLSPAGDLLSVVANGHGVDDEPKELWVMDTETGDVLHSFPVGGLTKARFTPDGRRLIFAVQRDIHVFDLKSQDEQIVRGAHKHGQSAMAMSDCGRWLATCGQEIKLWSLPSFETHAVMVGHQGGVTGLLFAPDSRTLLSSSHDGTVKAWSVTTGQLLMNLHAGDKSVTQMALSRDGRRLALIEARRRLRIYPIGTPTP